MRKLPETLLLLALLLVAVWLAWQFAWYQACRLSGETAPLQRPASLAARREIAADPPGFVRDLGKIGRPVWIFLGLGAALVAVPALGAVPPIRRRYGALRFAASAADRIVLLTLCVGVGLAVHLYFGPPFWSSFVIYKILPNPPLPPGASRGLALLRIALLLAVTARLIAVLLRATATIRRPQ